MLLCTFTSSSFASSSSYSFYVISSISGSYCRECLLIVYLGTCTSFLRILFLIIPVRYRLHLKPGPVTSKAQHHRDRSQPYSLDHKFGGDIDDHDTVIRMGYAPTAEYIPWVGAKTTMVLPRLKRDSQECKLAGPHFTTFSGSTCTSLSRCPRAGPSLSISFQPALECLSIFGALSGTTQVVSGRKGFT